MQSSNRSAFPFAYPPPPKPRSLALPRRARPARPSLDAWELSAAARHSIRGIVTAHPEDGDRVSELERSLGELEVRLAEWQKNLDEGAVRAAERERDLAEREALITARLRILTTSRPAPAGSTNPAFATGTADERAALERLRSQLDRHESAIKESWAVIRERERFLDESEARLFEKVQQQQEQEVAIEQALEDLKARERRFREREAAVDPHAAAALSSEDAAAALRNEFVE